MLPVSQSFIDTIKSDILHVRTKLEITWTDPYMDQSIDMSANEHARISWPKHAADGIEDTPYKYISLDGSWKLGEGFRIAPETEEEAASMQMGWWGKTLSDPVDGSFSSPYPQLNITFFARPVFGLKVVGDTARGEYPVNFDIKIYDDSNVLVHTEPVTDNTSVIWQKDVSGESLNSIIRMELIIKKWSHPGRQAKIAEFFSSIQEIYSDEKIQGLNFLEERESGSGGLPIGNITANELTIKLDNIDKRFHPMNISSPLHEKIKKNRKVRAWVGIDLPGGITEYLPLGTYWTGGWSVPEDDTYAETNARDRLDLMRETTFQGGVYTNKNLYELSVIVLEDYGLNSAQYFVDTELQDHTIPYAYFQPISHREALREIVEACMGQCYADRKDIIRVEGPSFIQLPE
jgi:hypothetical protein